MYIYIIIIHIIYKIYQNITLYVCISYIICIVCTICKLLYNPNSFAKAIDIAHHVARPLADLSGDQSGSIPSTYIKDQHWLMIPNIWCFHY